MISKIAKRVLNGKSVSAQEYTDAQRAAGRCRCGLERMNGSCLCCGESKEQFLTIDHIFSKRDIMYDGEPRKGPELYRFLIKNH